MRHGQMRIQRGTVRPVLVEDEDARVRGINVEVIIDAARFGAGRCDLRG